MNIVIAGYGTVGESIFRTLDGRKGLNLFIDDPHKGYDNVNRNGFVQIGTSPAPSYRTDVNAKVDAVIVCVSTPPRSTDGSCNTTNVFNVLDKYIGIPCLIKSAIDPKELVQKYSIDEARITYSPEFLGGSNVNRDANNEFKNQTFAIYGGDDCRFWDELLSPSLPELKDVRYTTLEQAAFSKYVENCFLATKVTFFNEMYQIYQSLGFEGFDTMVDAITLDPRIGKSHTQVPGPDGKFGYGGHCLPKDIGALQATAKHSGVDTPLLDSVVNANHINQKR